MNIDPIIEAVRLAMMLCREVQDESLQSAKKYTPDKNDSEPVTIADYGAQAIIARAISIHFPEDGIISEEAGSQFSALTSPSEKTHILNLLNHFLDVTVTTDDVINWLDHGKDRQSERMWVIDPIDGTKGFIARRHYAIGVGILQDGQPTGAIMGAPGFNSEVDDDDHGVIFYIKDNVAYMEPAEGGDAQPLHVSNLAGVEELRIVQSFEKKHASKDRMQRLREMIGLQEVNVVELDSMEKYALVAAGRADIYMRLPNVDSTRSHMSWDHAPGVALVIAAGGVVTDVDGSPLDFSQGKVLPNRGMLVSNGQIHDQLVAAATRLLAAE